MRALIFSLALLLGGAANAEYVSTQQLLMLDTAVRQKGDPGAGAFLTGYVTGVFDALKHNIHCADEKAVTVDQLLQAIRADESLHDKSADVAIGNALMRLAPMPCGTTPLSKGPSI